MRVPIGGRIVPCVSDETQERNNYRHNEIGTPRGGKKSARDRALLCPSGRLGARLGASTEIINKSGTGHRDAEKEKKV